MSSFDLSEAKSELRNAFKDLSERGLINGAKWYCFYTKIRISEHLFALKTEKKEKIKQYQKEEIDLEMEDLYFYAKSLFDMKEFLRCSDYLEKIKKSTSNQYYKCLFLKLYSKFLAGEKRKEEEAIEIESKSNIKPVNKELSEIHSEILSTKSNDPFLKYLLGVVSKEMNRKNESIAYFVSSINSYPLLWSSWDELIHLSTEREIYEEILSNLKHQHWIVQFFIGKAQKELQLNEDALGIFQQLFQYFPSTWLSNQISMTFYHMTEYEEAQERFENTRKKDQYCLDCMDTYSNILFVRDEKAKLSFLAHESHLNDKYKPETCVINGNYYSRKGDHAKAILYFKRAIKLDASYISAWTLMGHEYMEIKNASEAIKAYRTSVEINPKDFRAWYGLGQAYELLQMNLYSIYYYGKASALRPYDSRMWIALGNVYEQLTRYKDALRCYERARKNKDPDGTALIKMGNLYYCIGNKQQSAECYIQHLSEKEQSDYDHKDFQAILSLAKYFRDNSEFEESEKYCNLLLSYDTNEVEEAKSILKEIRNLTQLQKLPF